MQRLKSSVFAVWTLDKLFRGFKKMFFYILKAQSKVTDPPEVSGGWPTSPASLRTTAGASPRRETALEVSLFSAAGGWSTVTWPPNFCPPSGLIIWIRRQKFCCKIWWNFFSFSLQPLQPYIIFYNMICRPWNYTLWGGPGPRLEPGTDGLEARILTTRQTTTPT